MKRERGSRRGRGGGRVEWGPLWVPAVPFLGGAQDRQENPTRGIPVPQTGSHTQPPLPLRVPRSRFLRLMRITLHFQYPQSGSRLCNRISLMASVSTKQTFSTLRAGRDAATDSRKD